MRLLPAALRLAVLPALAFLATVPAAAATVSLGSAGCFAVLSDGTMALSSGTTTIRGVVGLGPTATQNFTNGRILGQLEVDPSANNSHPNTVSVAGGAVTESLKKALADAGKAAATIEGLAPTQSFGAIASTTTVTGNGGVNVVAISAITLSGTNTLTLSGGPNDVFYVRVAGGVELSQAAQILLSGVPAAQVIFTAGRLTMSGTSVAEGSFLLFGSGGSVSVDGATLNGALLTSSKAVSFAHGASVTPSCIPAAMTGALTAAQGKWTFVSFWDAFCANGATTGIGINLAKGSDDVLIYLEGGGACWSELTCYLLQTATYITTGYGKKQFAAELPTLTAAGGFFDRTSAANPFRKYNFIYVPYCTGDMHGGRNAVDYIVSGSPHLTMFDGASNFTAYLARIRATFPKAKQVVLAGSSFGGFGAVLHWGETQTAFGSVPVDMIDDSGTFMPAGFDIPGVSDGTWNVQALLPSGCTACSSTDLSALYGYYAQAFPNDRGTLLSYIDDSVLPSYYAITAGQFTAGLQTVLTQEFAPNANLQYFTVGGAGHVLFFNPTLSVNDVTVETFLTEMVTGAPWTSVNG